MRIALIGFMGAGKTTVGRILAGALNANHIDLDSAIEQSTHKTIPELFSFGGEKHFREIEIRELNWITQNVPDVVLSTGGGVVTMPESIDMLRTDWVCVYLQAQSETILDRVLRDPTPRPILADSVSRGSKIHELLAIRHPLYLSVAHHLVDVDDLTPEEVAEDILIRIQCP